MHRWPWDQVFTPQMPTAVLYYNNELTFRGPPDQEYLIRISAYKIDYSFAGGTTHNAGSILANVPQAYLNSLFRLWSFSRHPERLWRDG
jgi:hypothetical protein